MTFTQGHPHKWNAYEQIRMTERILVKKAHEESWNIDYGFVSCNKRQRDQYRPKITEAIDRAINLWLSPIKRIRKAINDGRISSDPIIDSTKPLPELVSKFDKSEKKKIFSHDSSVRDKEGKKQKGYTPFDVGKYRKLLRKLDAKLKKMPDQSSIEQTKEFKRFRKFIVTLPEMSIVFVCKRGISFMIPYTNAITMYEEETKNNIPETNFSFGTLSHEVGHTFGLADTYVNAKDPTRDHMESTGGMGHTIGNQPLSLMSTSGHLFGSYESVSLTVDDMDGIFWIYAHMNMNKLKFATCPLHYQPEFFARGVKTPSIACRPEHPLLSAMARKNYSTTRLILINEPEREQIDINARVREQGFTAIHYAVWLAPVGLIEEILKRFHKEIDFSIVGFHRETDFSIAGPQLKDSSLSFTPLELAKTLLAMAIQRNNKQLIEKYSAIVELLVRYSGDTT